MFHLYANESDNLSIAHMPLLTDNLLLAEETARSFVQNFDTGWQQAVVFSIDMSDSDAWVIRSMINGCGPNDWIIDNSTADTAMLSRPHLIPANWIGSEDDLPLAFYCEDCNRFTDHETCDPTI